MKKVRVRYAPSPTGHLHIGNARTAMFNYLFAKHYDGDFVLRIEDTDIERNVEGGEASQNYYMQWLGITPDEGPDHPNPKYAPYRQMERLALYTQYAQELLDKGYAYKCFCTSEDLEADYQRQSEAGYASTRYNRKCVHLDAQTIAQYEAEGRPYTIRVRVPDEETYEFEDMIRGVVRFESKDMGDWVLVKANGIPTYNYAVVVDDHLMDITHVFRGEEHLSNTPKQMMIYRMLGWEIPKFGHMTLIVNENHKKLSKRDNQIMQFMSQYKELGYLPEAMFNFMALLGWSPETEQEIFTKEELVRAFSEHRLSKSPSMFDKNKLAWVNNRYIKEMPLDVLVRFCRPFLDEAYDMSKYSDAFVQQLVSLYHDQMSYGAEIVTLAKQFFVDEPLSEEAQEVLTWVTTPTVKSAFKAELEAITQWDAASVKAAFEAAKQKTGIKGKPLFMGLRVVIMHQMHGPDLVNSILLVGKETVLERLS